MKNIRTTIVRLFSPLAHFRILIRFSFIVVKSEGPEAAELDHKPYKSIRSWWDGRRGRGEIERECGGDVKRERGGCKEPEETSETVTEGPKRNLRGPQGIVFFRHYPHHKHHAHRYVGEFSVKFISTNPLQALPFLSPGSTSWMTSPTFFYCCFSSNDLTTRSGDVSRSVHNQG